MLRHKAIRKISAKKAAQIIKEKELALMVYLRQDGKCAGCGIKLGWGAAKHEIIFRSHGGEISLDNCQLLCYACHMKEHGLRPVKSEPQWSK